MTAGRYRISAIVQRGLLLAGFLAAASSLNAGSYGTTIIDPTVGYTNSTGGGGLGSFADSGLDPGYDDDEVLFRFSVSGNSVFTAFTTSFATGGFAPDLTLFADDGTFGDPTGLYIASGAEGIAGQPGNAGCGPTQAIDSATGACDDSFLQTALAPGNYLLVLTEDFNPSDGLGSTFDYGNAFAPYAPFYFNGSGYSPSQVDFNGGFNWEGNPEFQRTENYTLEADLAPAASTPEPGSLLLLFTGLVAGGFLCRRKHSSPIQEERP